MKASDHCFSWLLDIDIKVYGSKFSLLANWYKHEGLPGQTKWCQWNKSLIANWFKLRGSTVAEIDNFWK